jgi:serine protease Do
MFTKLKYPLFYLSFYLTVLTLLFVANGTYFYAQTNTERIRQAAITPEKLSASFAEVAKAVEAAVVNIDTKGKIPDVSLRGEREEKLPDDISDYYRRQRRPSYSVGSGFIVDKSGYIITNYHVVNDASRITVGLWNGEEYPAQIVGLDEETDLAVLKIEADKDLPFLKFADSEKVKVGDWVLAIGSPFGLAQTVTAGIISQVKRETPSTTSFQKFIQTDAAINRGNSGGPLVNMDGEVIGVNSQIATSTGDYNGIGFALPSNDALYVYRKILRDGRVRRGYLGVILDSVKAEFAKVYGLPEAKGAIITNIQDKKSAAATAGLLPGDVILEFDGQKVENAMDLISKVAGSEPDKNVTILILRESGDVLERKTVSVRLAERPSNNRVPTDENSRRRLPVGNQNEPVKPFGLTLTELTPTLAASYKLQGQKGLVVRNINPASYIADVKTSNGSEALREGDVILRINRREVTDLKTFNEIAGSLKKGDAVVLHVLSKELQTRVVQFTVQ